MFHILTPYSQLYRKHAVVSQTSELEALEARLRATEERLKANGLAVAPRSPSQRLPLRHVLGQAGSTERSEQTSSTSPTAQQPKQASRPTTATRPGTGKAREDSYSNLPMPGGLPPTPGASEGEYVEASAENAMIADYIVLNKDGREIDEADVRLPSNPQAT